MECGGGRGEAGSFDGFALASSALFAKYPSRKSTREPMTPSPSHRLPFPRSVETTEMQLQLQQQFDAERERNYNLTIFQSTPFFSTNPSTCIAPRNASS